MKESDFQTRFGRWIRNNGSGARELGAGACVFELKFVRGFSRGIRFDAVADHQVRALALTEGREGREGREGCEGHEGGGSGYGSGGGSGGLYYKLSDLSLGMKPFDCFWMNGGETRAFVVVGWWNEKQGRGSIVCAVFVRISDWLAIRENVLNRTGRVRKSVRMSVLVSKAAHVVEM